MLQQREESALKIERQYCRLLHDRAFRALERIASVYRFIRDVVASRIPLATRGRAADQCQSHGRGGRMQDPDVVSRHSGSRCTARFSEESGITIDLAIRGFDDLGFYECQTTGEHLRVLQ